MKTNGVSTALQLSSGQPLYKQIEREIMQCLARREWKPGDQLPTESELAARFGVAIFTVRAGIGELVDSGILTRKQGKGTFVARHERDRTRQVFARIFDNDNRKVIPKIEAVTYFRKQLADDRTRDLLKIVAPKSYVFHWEVVVETEERPICVRHITVPVGLFPTLNARILRENRNNLYALYQDLCGISVVRLEDRVHAVRADAHCARLLRLNRGDPLLKIDRIAFTYNSVPVEVRTHVYDSSRFHYRSDQPGV